MKICCQRRKLLEFMRENFFIYKKLFLRKAERGHWRGIDSRKLPSAEKTLGETKKFL